MRPILLNQLYKPIQKELEDVETYIEKVITSENVFIAKNIPYILRAGGKRFRPALLLLSAKIFNSIGERAIKLATAIELIHTASLIHDDIIDNDTFRRGHPTLNTQIGDNVTVKLGDYIYSLVFSMLAEIHDIGIIQCVVKTTSKMARGDIQQIRERYNIHLSEERYFQINADKTASLISCACKLGALCGTTSDKEIELITRYGYNFGMAFQIADDLLDIIAEEHILGKPLGSDIREGKITLPLICILSKVDKSERAWIEQLITSRSIDDTSLSRIRTMVVHYNGIEYSRNKALEFARNAKEACQELEKSDVRDVFVSFADFVVHRTN